MTWARLDDHLDENLKVVGLSDRAFRAFVESVCYSARNLTDGFIPHAVALRRWPKVRTDLLGAGLWESREFGYQVHDYLEYNPSRERILAQREAERQRKSGRNPDQGDRPRTRNPDPDPKPRPKPLAPTNGAGSASERTMLKNALVAAWGVERDHVTPTAWKRVEAAAKELSLLSPVPDADDIAACGRDLGRAWGADKVTPHSIAANFADWAAGKIQLAGRRR